MTDIIIYAFGVMYTPGPVNAIALNKGIQKQTHIFGFVTGVAVAMFILFYSVAFIGEQVMNDSLLKGASVLGSLYILWLACKVFRTQVGVYPSAQPRMLTFRDGMLIQLLNPKGIIVALPVATVQFPAAGITGVTLLVWCVGLAIFAFGAPWSYFVFGRLIGRSINQARYLTAINRLMALFLLFVSISMGITPFIH